MRGSPPLTRERPIIYRKTLVKEGITPAHAGKTPCLGMVPMPMGDHPRSRGKDLWLHMTILKKVGSPPLTRERRKRSLYSSHYCRL